MSQPVSPGGSTTRATPKPIEARPLRHPGRWVAAAIILALLAWFIIGALNNEAYGWDTYLTYLFDTRIATAALHTIALTVLSMIIGVVLGATLAVMRMSGNPVLGSLYQTVNLGFAELDLQNFLSNMFILAVLGLGLNEAAYMAEIVRSGIQAVPEGQMEASKALGMGWSLTMRRTVLPQAMRIIIPPTGNELISMLKTTSLVVAVPYSLELYGRSMDIAYSLFEPVPMLLVAATWYLVITSVLMVGQYYLEKHFEKGSTRNLTARQLAALADAEGAIPGNVNVVPDTPKENR